MTYRQLVLALSLVVGLADRSPAQLSAAQALGQFKAALADSLGNTKSDMASAKAEFFDALATFEAALKAGPYSIGDGLALFDALQTMMGDVGAATRAAGNSLGIAANDALAGFAGGAALNGIFPKGFYTGDGGPIDVYRAAVRKAQDKIIAAVIKRFAKTRKLAEKANIGLTVALAAPGAVRDLFYDGETGFSLSDESPITVDVLIAVSDLGQASDATVFLGGTANPNLGAVAVVLKGPEEFLDSGGVPTSEKERWGVVFINAGLGLPEGSYICLATQGTGGSLATGSIGAR